MNDLIKEADKLEVYLDRAINGPWMANHLEEAREALTAYRNERRKIAKQGEK